MKKPYSYFARAIRGSRENLENCRVIVAEMKKFSDVLNEHVVYDNVFEWETEWQRLHPNISIYDRDMGWIEKSTVFVADVTAESLGVGYEISTAQHIGLASAIFCHENMRNTRKYLAVEKEWIPFDIELYLRAKGISMPRFYYNENNVRQIAEIEIRNLFLGKVAQIVDKI